MSKPPKVFITYAHENKAERDILIKRLVVMTRNNDLEIWYDDKISGGDSWKAEIEKNLAESDILIYLVSADSLASPACYDEMIDAIDQGVKVIPVILEDCDWREDKQIVALLVLPEDGKPINTCIPESKGWQGVVAGIRKASRKIGKKKDTDSFSDFFQADQYRHDI